MVDEWWICSISIEVERDLVQEEHLGLTANPPFQIRDRVTMHHTSVNDHIAR